MSRMRYPLERTVVCWEGRHGACEYPGGSGPGKCECPCHIKGATAVHEKDGAAWAAFGRAAHGLLKLGWQPAALKEEVDAVVDDRAACGIEVNQ